MDKFHRAVFPDPTVPNGLNQQIDFRAVTLDHDRLLSNYRQEWAERFERDSDHSGARFLPISLPPRAASLTFSDHGADAACEFRVKLLPLYVPRDVSDVRAF
jgi:hypothetical protein